MLIETHADHLQYFEHEANTETPYVIEFDSNTPGPHLLFCVGLHGDEPGGVEGAIQLHTGLETELINLNKGKVSLLLGNPLAYAEGVRFKELNLNRILNKKFPERAPATEEEKRAIEIAKHIILRRHELTAIIDFHSVSKDDLTMLVFNRDNPSSEKLARKLPKLFESVFTFSAGQIDGSLIGLASQLGIDTFAIECGNHNSAVHRAILYMRFALTHYGLQLQDSENKTPKGLPIIENPIRYDTIEPIVPAEGFKFTDPKVKTGAQLKEGEVFATSSVGEHRAPTDCTIVMPSAKPNHEDPDVGFFCKERFLN